MTALSPSRSGRGISGWLFDQMTRPATVIEVEQIRPRMRRIRLGGPEVADSQWRPGQQVRVVVQDEQAREYLRTYSVFAFDQAAGTLDLCVFGHADDTPGGCWSRRVKAGDAAAFRGPEGRLVLRDEAAYHLFVGEETAQVAFAPMLAALPAAASVFGAIEVAGQQDRLDLDRSDELTWRYRGTAGAADSASLLEAVRHLDFPRHPGAAYLAGEARACQAVRRHLIAERGWPRGSIVVKPFWTPGKRGLD